MCCGKKPANKKRRPSIRHFVPSESAKSLMSFKVPAKKKFLLCRPDFYGIQYKINAWMNPGNQSNHQKAIEQWDNLRDRIEEHGGEVSYLKPHPGLPDMVFTANAGIIIKDSKTFIASNFKHEERKGEEEHFISWFANNDYKIAYPIAPFEGAGDALSLGDTLIKGYGFRSELSGYESIQPLLKDSILVNLIDNRFYHLDTCFCPLSKNDYMIFPDAFLAEDLEKIRSLGFEEITVPEDEAAKFACNAICIDNAVILPSGCPNTMQMLQNKGYTAVPVDMSEFLKSGGACKCLTLEIP